MEGLSVDECAGGELLSGADVEEGGLGEKDFNASPFSVDLPFVVSSPYKMSAMKKPDFLLLVLLWNVVAEEHVCWSFGPSSWLCENNFGDDILLSVLSASFSILLHLLHVNGILMQHLK